jgi:hypothetical protein
MICMVPGNILLEYIINFTSGWLVATWLIVLHFYASCLQVVAMAGCDLHVDVAHVAVVLRSELPS